MEIFDQKKSSTPLQSLSNFDRLYDTSTRYTFRPDCEKKSKTTEQSSSLPRERKSRSEIVGLGMGYSAPPSGNSVSKSGGVVPSSSDEEVNLVTNCVSALTIEKTDT